jgi:hypothetical protein
MLPNLYDVYISIPLRIERALRGQDEELVRPAPPRPATGAVAGASGGGSA